MALSDIDAASVLAAMREYDGLGREKFLEHYGFGAARSYFIEHDSKLYDSKAIIGAAHGYATGTPLRAPEFSGGDATVARLLGRLGFTVTNPGHEWQTPIGAVLNRRQIVEQYGGARFGGIEPSARTPNVFIFTDPAAGEEFGYNYDGWDADDDRVFYYTGEGPSGDQQLTGGNKSIADAAELGRTLRVFEALDEKAPPGGKRHRYLGGFRLDGAAPYRREPGEGQDGLPRTVIVFRLIRDDLVPEAIAAATEPPPPSGEPPIIVGRAQPNATPASRAPAVAREVELVPSEQNTVTEFEIAPRAGAIATKEEAKLVAAFEAHLRDQGHDVQRARIPIPGERNTLVTDPYDLTTGVLYEAKSGVDRATVRLGVGQLLDYLRFVPEARGALLLPQRPSEDLCEFIRSCGFGLVYRQLGSWVAVDI